MQNFILDASKLLNRKEAHEYICATLSFPDYYGHNLDALYDMLTSISEPTTITLTHIDLLEQQGTNHYGKLLLEVFQDSALENDFLTVNQLRETSI